MYQLRLPSCRVVIIIIIIVVVVVVAFGDDDGGRGTATYRDIAKFRKTRSHLVIY
jgi:hypothetical protein